MPETAMPDPPPASARQRIIAAAGPLFYREGFRAIGVDRVIAEADVAKATFYKHFPSKDDLIVAWINASAAEMQRAEPPAGGPEALTDYALAMIALAVRHACLGCTYQVSAAEFADPDHPAHRAALAEKRRTLADLEQRAAAQGLTPPRAAAEAVFLFIEGVWAAKRMFGGTAPLDNAPAAVRCLIEGFARRHA